MPITFQLSAQRAALTASHSGFCFQSLSPFFIFKATGTKSSLVFLMLFFLLLFWTGRNQTFFVGGKQSARVVRRLWPTMPFSVCFLRRALVHKHPLSPTPPLLLLLLLFASRKIISLLERKKACVFGSRNDDGGIIPVSFCNESKDPVHVCCFFFVFFALFSLLSKDALVLNVHLRSLKRENSGTKLPA